MKINENPWKSMKIYRPTVGGGVMGGDHQKTDANLFRFQLLFQGQKSGAGSHTDAPCLGTQNRQHDIWNYIQFKSYKVK